MIPLGPSRRSLLYDDCAEHSFSDACMSSSRRNRRRALTGSSVQSRESSTGLTVVGTSEGLERTTFDLLCERRVTKRTNTGSPSLSDSSNASRVMSYASC